VGESLKEEIKLLSSLDRSANETNVKLTATLEVITDALKTLPVTEARQTEVMEGIREHLRESADLQAVLQEISERSRTQSQHVAALEKDVREGLTRMRKTESRRMRTSNIILFLILIAILVMGIAALGSLSRISGPSNTATGAAP
jgi:Flp pilus assembly protein TadB